MSPLPLPIRVAAGLAAAGVDQARRLPQQIAGLPVTAVSRVLQASMRAQQRITELAIRGDEVLSLLTPAQETPSWATFDEDLDVRVPPPQGGVATATTTESPDEVAGTLENVPTRARPGEDGAKPRGETTQQPEPAQPGPVQPGPVQSGPVQSGPVQSGPAEAGTKPPLPGYDEMTLPQLRARLRTLSEQQLQQLLEYERAHADRAAFVTMLTNRITTVRGR